MTASTEQEILEKVATECTTECTGPEHLFHIRHWLPGNPSTPSDVRRALRTGHLDHRIATAIQEHFRRHPTALLPTFPAPDVPAPEPGGMSV